MTETEEAKSTRKRRGRQPKSQNADNGLLGSEGFAEIQTAGDTGAYNQERSNRGQIQAVTTKRGNASKTEASQSKEDADIDKEKEGRGKETVPAKARGKAVQNAEKIEDAVELELAEKSEKNSKATVIRNTASGSQKNIDAGDKDAPDDIPPKKRGKAAKSATSKKNGNDDGKKDADVSDDEGDESPPKHAKSGVDLVPIKPLPNVISLTEDITTDHCRQKIRHELKSWKADVVLHDGAPNVGKNWLHDAFAQSRLVLSAFKLASDFLTKGGWFITKVFRSKDYHALLWVFKQFFRKVVATKPPASRSESAEIFVVCIGYNAPDKIDPKLLDPRTVFQDVEGNLEDGEMDPTSGKRLTGAAKLSLLMHPEKKKKSAEGYSDNKVLSLLERLNARDYIAAEEDRSKELLSACHVIVIDEELMKNPATTEEIVQSCQDIKVLGRREIKLIMAWRNKIRKQEEKAAKLEKEKTAAASGLVTVQPVEDDDDTQMQKQIDRLAEEERLEARRKRKKINKLRRQLQERMNLKMVIPGDSLLPEDTQTEQALFALESIKSRKGLEKVVADEAKEEEDEDWEEESDEEENPLLVDRETRGNRKERMMEEWFDKEIFRGVDLDGTKVNKSNAKAAMVEEMDDDSDDEMEFEVIQEEKEETDEKPTIKLDPEGFALAEELIKSKKRKREIIEAGIHREAFNEPDAALPTWFVDDEKKHCRRTVVDQGLVTKEQVQAHREQLKAIDARPIKKIAEAQARKKRRTLKRLEKARKKAGKVLAEEGQSSQEKIQQLKTIYKKAKIKTKRKAPTIIVSKKGGGSRAPEKREKGARVKVVDRRMKKDLRGMKRAEKAKKGGKKAGKRR